MVLRRISVPALLCFMFLLGGNAMPEEPQSSGSVQAGQGHLLIIGGGLRPDNRAVFEKLIDLAGGPQQARFVVIPSASIAMNGAFEFCMKLGLYGIASERATVLNVMENNASTATSDRTNLELVRQATAVYFSGGDQRRLVRLLTTAEGNDTPLLNEIRGVFARGGLIAGSSAGASAQSERMLAVSGLPDMLTDEGLDALDYGITSNEKQRGLMITKGFGFFKAGIIDQHFFQFRGRLGRLIRATSESGLACGLGIDENTAIVVQPDQRLQVIGTGFVTVVQPGEHRGQDGPLGYQISDVNLSLLSDGDAFDLNSETVQVSKTKIPLPPEQIGYSGNFLINDISAGGQAPFALIRGLADNQRSVQEAVAIKFHGETTHGYRFRFSKRPTTQTFVGMVDHLPLTSFVNARLDISPIANGLSPSQSQVPVDLEEGPHRNALVAVAFRGLLPANSERQFRPTAPIKRGEFAAALARSVHLPSVPGGPIADVDVESLEGDELAQAVSAGLAALDEQQALKPQDALSPAAAIIGLTKVAEINQELVDADLLQQIARLNENQPPFVTRAEVGVLLHKILKLPD